MDNRHGWTRIPTMREVRYYFRGYKQVWRINRFFAVYVRPNKKGRNRYSIKWILSDIYDHIVLRWLFVGLSFVFVVLLYTFVF